MRCEAFLAWQPVPSRLAYHMYHRLPDSFFVAALYGTYAVEILFPCGIFLQPELAQAVGVLVIALQIGIHLSGNYGIFNLLTALLCLPLWDGERGYPFLHATGELATGLLAGPTTATLSQATIWLATALYAIAGLVYLPWDSFNTLTWLHGRRQRRDMLEALPGGAMAVAVLRALAPFRLWHAYGVFDAKAPEKSKQGFRVCAVVEASLNGKQWALWPYRYGLGDPAGAPKHFAPYQPRIDHQMFYEARRTHAPYSSIPARSEPY